MTREEIIRRLKEKNPARLAALWNRADAVRRERVGDEVHLRGLIEISNHCVRRCAYCGLGVGHSAVSRYRMTPDETLACAREAVSFGYGTVVLQSGEDPGITGPWMADLVRRIKQETPLAVTLSLGERSDEEFQMWRAAGADRYLLRFETSDRALYDRIHPSLPGKRSDRIAILRRLRALGYEVGSGIMIGIPGQTWDVLANDLLTFASLDLDMIGVGPFIPHPGTPLGGRDGGSQNRLGEQVPNTEEMTYKVMALARLLCPDANIPSATALATLNRETGRERGLQRGANIVMPNLTPVRYRALYEIYPGKACVTETAADCHACLRRRIESIGRRVGSGRGDSIHFTRRNKMDWPRSGEGAENESSALRALRSVCAPSGPDEL